MRSSPGNALVDGATVSLTPADPAVKLPTPVDSTNGAASFTDLPAGSYTITASKTSTSQTGTKVASVTVGGNTSVTVTIS